MQTTSMCSHQRPNRVFTKPDSEVCATSPPTSGDTTFYVLCPSLSCRSGQPLRLELNKAERLRSVYLLAAQDVLRSW